MVIKRCHKTTNRNVINQKEGLTISEIHVHLKAAL